MNRKQLLYKLRKMIPECSCNMPGCHACCGPVPWSKEERNELPERFQNMTKKGNSLNCVFECENGCAVYEYRPIVCRLFGISDEPRLRCPHGFIADKTLTVKQTEEITKLYLDLIGSR